MAIEGMMCSYTKFTFSVMGCLMVAILICTISIDGLPSRKDLTPWMVQTLADSYISVVPLAAWVLYRESNWLSAILWIILLVCFGSITTCAYIVMQFFKLTTSQALEDPIYYVLLRNPDMDGMEHKRKHSYVWILRIFFSALGFLMLGTLVYTILVDGFPSHQEILTLWMAITLLDIYIKLVALSVWVIYKEPCRISAILWIILLISFGSITTCFYIAWKLFQLTSGDPVYVVLLNSGNSYNSEQCENRWNCGEDRRTEGILEKLQQLSIGSNKGETYNSGRKLAYSSDLLMAPKPNTIIKYEHQKLERRKKVNIGFRLAETATTIIADDMETNDAGGAHDPCPKRLLPYLSRP